MSKINKWVGENEEILRLKERMNLWMQLKANCEEHYQNRKCCKVSGTSLNKIGCKLNGTETLRVYLKSEGCMILTINECLFEGLETFSFQKVLHNRNLSTSPTQKRKNIKQKISKLLLWKQSYTLMHSFKNQHL